MRTCFSSDKRYHPTRHSGRKQALNKLNLTDEVKDRHDNEFKDDVNVDACEIAMFDKSAGPTRFALSEFVINNQTTKDTKVVRQGKVG